MTESLKSTPGGEWLDGLEIGALGAADAEDALSVLARGMRDNPVHVAVYGEAREPRVVTAEPKERFYELRGWN
ncbi:MAG: hypothetical protein ACJ73W_01145 [Rubrobacteraceae bacterium]